MQENRLTDLSVIRELLNRHGFNVSKSLGQNFLINPSVCPKMAEAAASGGTVNVLEIGPGLGVLTRELSSKFEKVLSVEIDNRLKPILAETLSGYDNVQVEFGDVLKLDLVAVTQKVFGGVKFAVCANLPYYITTVIIMMLLKSGLPIESVTIMIQKEVAMRLCSTMGTRESSAITAAVQYYTEPQMLFGVSAGSFFPAPKVDSAALRLKMREFTAAQVDNEDQFFNVIRAAFEHRRKTLPNSLSAELPIQKADILSAMESAGIPETSRAERLTLEDFAALTHCLYSVK